MVLVTALISIAERVGANRIFNAEGRFHHPLGDLELTPQAEAAWRTNFLRVAVRMVAQPVEGPTVKTLSQAAA